MFVLENFVIAIAALLDTVINLYTIVIVIAAIISWVNPDPYNPIVRTLRVLTEPVFYRIRKWFPFVFIGGIDLSPLVLLLLLQLINGVVVSSLYQLARML